MDISKIQSDRILEKTVQGAGASDRAKKKDLEAAHSPVKQSSSEKVEWSEDARLMSEGLEAVKKAPDVRADKVAALKAKIASGDYKIDSKAIAEKMIHESLADDLLTRKG